MSCFLTSTFVGLCFAEHKFCVTKCTYVYKNVISKVFRFISDVSSVLSSVMPILFSFFACTKVRKMLNRFLSDKWKHAMYREYDACHVGKNSECHLQMAYSFVILIRILEAIVQRDSGYTKVNTKPLQKLTSFYFDLQTF